jgi:hypothetical protein
MFGHMRRFESKPMEAMLIPDESVVNDQTRQLAYVVGSDDVVQQRTIELGRLIDDMRVIRSGLNASDRVIISGVQRARAGRKVNAKAGQMSAFPSGVSRGENSKLEMPHAPAPAPTTGSPQGSVPASTADSPPGSAPASTADSPPGSAPASTADSPRRSAPASTTGSPQPQASAPELAQRRGQGSAR